MANHWSYEADEAYRDGRRDGRCGKVSYEYDRYSDEEKDRAYFVGLREAQDAARRQRAEEEEQERQEYERQMQKQMQDELDRQIQYEQDRQEQDYYESLQKQEEPKQPKEKNGNNKKGRR